MKIHRASHERGRTRTALREAQAALADRDRALAELARLNDELVALVVDDFKSPLTVVQAGLDFALADHAIDARAREALEDARLSSRQLLDLVGNLVETRRLEEARPRLRPAAVELRRWLEQVAAARQQEARDRRLSVECRIGEAGAFTFDRALVSRAVDNLVDNAIRHAPPGGRVVLAAFRRHGALELRVGNSGPPIPREVRARIFEKFGRAPGEERSLHLGLGLYLCRLIAEAHGGALWLEDGLELPTVFALRLPEAPAPAAG